MSKDNNIRVKRCKDSRDHGCDRILSVTKFFPKADMSTGLSSLCRACYYKTYPNKYDGKIHRDPMRSKLRKWREKNRANYTEYMRQYQLQRMLDPMHRLNQASRSRFLTTLKKFVTGKKMYNSSFVKFEALVGCELYRFVEYASEKYKKRYGRDIDFTKWTTDVDQSERIEIDHIQALRAFDTLDLDQQKQAWYFTNLEFVSFYDNRRK